MLFRSEQLSDDDDYLTVVAGDGLYYLIEWTADGEQIIRGTHQYGSQMTDHSSEHYLDQAEAFAQETLRAPGFHKANRARPTRRYTVASPVSDLMLQGQINPVFTALSRNQRIKL